MNFPDRKHTHRRSCILNLIKNFTGYSRKDREDYNCYLWKKIYNTSLKAHITGGTLGQSQRISMAKEAIAERVLFIKGYLLKVL